MTREAKTKDLAEAILDVCSGNNPSMILTALAIASATVAADVGRDDVSNAELTHAFAQSFGTALDQMRGYVPETLQ